MVVRVLALVALAAASAFAQNEGAWYETGVVYQIYPRSFQDSNGDGIGDLNGIIRHVDYLDELGVDAVWLNPIYPSPQKDFGYDISDMKAIDPVYGTMADFDNLLSALKSKGIKVILDYVPNHTSDQHEWFKKSVANDPLYKDYYVWLPPSSVNPINKTMNPPNNWVGNFDGSMWEYHPGRKQFYLHQFLKYQPDLNYRNRNVVEAMKDVLKFWLDKGVHGFRMDAVFAMVENSSWQNEPYIGGPENSYSSYKHTMTAEQKETFDVLREFREVLDEYAKTKDNITRLMMTESYNTNYADIQKYYGTPPAPVSTFPFNFFWITQGKPETTASQWAKLINDWYTQAMPAGDWAQANFVLGNHDQHRIASRLSSEHSDLMNILQLVLKGTAVVYFGDEIGLQDSMLRRDQGVDPVGINAEPGGFMRTSRDPERAPMPWSDQMNGGFTTNFRPWLPLATSYWNLNVEAQMSAPSSHLKVFKQMMTLRRNNNMNARSCEVSAVGDILVVIRALEDNPTLLTILNFSTKEQIIDLLQVRNTLRPSLNILVKTVNYEAIESQNNNTRKEVDTNNIILPPLTGLVLSSY